MQQPISRSGNQVPAHVDMIKAGVIAILLILSLALVVGCESDDLPSNAPEGHTTGQDGVAHKPGLENPATNCVACHGASLDGGESGEPSCFTCHGRKW